MKLTEKKPLGRTGISVPPIIYGTSYLGNLYRAIPYKEKLALIRKWFECTVTPVVIDTAGKYGAGLALEMIGKGLRELNIDPEDIIISNKLGWHRVPLTSGEPTFEPGAWAGLSNDAVQTFSYDGIMECYEQGNELLGGIYKTDLVSVHDPDEFLYAAKDDEDRHRRFSQVLEAYRALFDLKKENKVKAVGIGSKDWYSIRSLYEHVPFDWVMLANSFTIFSHPPDLLAFMKRLQKEGVGIINSAVFHGGFLTGGDLFDYQGIPPDSERGRIIYHWREGFSDVCRLNHVNPAHACMQFGISHPAIASIALNTSKPEKMDHNTEVLFNKLPGAFWENLKTERLIDPEYAYV